ncbi:hypothetical protein [Limosilactobacillus sp. DJ3M12]|uniref:hypothetical protein n=1 Tax=Limosilactobacillus sp. DJ3M12 TaxID=2991835 RepID=UPI0024BBE3AB|nr:hypothetical protein [Limosilactobacillus sp. DJ3M12]
MDRFELKDNGLYINGTRIEGITSLKIDCPDTSNYSELTIKVVGKLKGIDYPGLLYFKKPQIEDDL